MRFRLVGGAEPLFMLGLLEYSLCIIRPSSEAYPVAQELGRRILSRRLLSAHREMARSHVYPAIRCRVHHLCHLVYCDIVCVPSGIQYMSLHLSIRHCEYSFKLTQVLLLTYCGIYRPWCFLTRHGGFA